MYTFTDLIRLSKADAVVRRALTGHVTQEMQQHYSNVGTEEKRAAIAGALKLLADTNAAQHDQPRANKPASVNLGVNRGGFRGGARFAAMLVSELTHLAAPPSARRTPADPFDEFN